LNRLRKKQGGKKGQEGGVVEKKKRLSKRRNRWGFAENIMGKTKNKKVGGISVERNSKAQGARVGGRNWEKKRLQVVCGKGVSRGRPELPPGGNGNDLEKKKERGPWGGKVKKRPLLQTKVGGKIELEEVKKVLKSPGF